MPKLVYYINSKKTSFKLHNYITVIGRDDICEIKIDDEKISKKHCRIEFEGGEYFVEDLTSRNGTYVNNKFISKRTQLKNRDVITVGSCNLMFHKPLNLFEISLMFFANKSSRRILISIVIVAIILLIAYLGYETFSKLTSKRPHTENIEKTDVK